MAGIGFELRKLSRRDNLFAPLASMGHAAVIAAGPWIFTAAALVAITSLSGPFVDDETLAGFRVLGIYAFCLSLIGTAPVAIVATRLVSDAIYLKQYDKIRPLIVAAMALGASLTAALAMLVFVAWFHVPLDLALVGTSASALIAMIWISLAFCGAVRDYRWITTSFVLGLTVAAAGTTSHIALRHGIMGMMSGFIIGLSVIFFGLTARLLSTFPQPVCDTREPLAKLVAGIGHYRLLALGALLSSLAIWVDKWIMWTGPIGEELEMGLIHAPQYDSAMFIACLTGIPGLALFVTTLETSFLERYRSYYDAIAGHAALKEITANAERLERETMRTIVRIVCIQATISAIFTLAASLVVTATGLLYQQAGILRMGVLAALFQFLFFTSSSLLLFFSRYQQYCALQLLFLTTNAVFTMMTLQYGLEYYGLGTLLASICSGLLAFLVLERTMRQLNYLTFIVGNRETAFAI